MHKNCVSFVQQGHFNGFPVSIHDPDPSPHLRPSFRHSPPSPCRPGKFDNARMPNVHRPAFTPATASTARIDRSRDSFPRRWEKARGNDIWKNGTDRETKRNRSRPFNVSALSSAIYHRACISRLRDLETLRFVWVFFFLSFPFFSTGYVRFFRASESQP